MRLHHDQHKANILSQIHYSLVVLAIIGAGGIFTGTNPAYTTTELRHHLGISQARFAFIESTESVVAHFVDSLERTKISKEKIWAFGGSDSLDSHGEILSWKSLLSQGEEGWIRFDDLSAAQSTVAARFFSSGTTGLPKAVDITHCNLLAQHALVFEAHPRPYRVSELVSFPTLCLIDLS